MGATVKASSPVACGAGLVALDQLLSVDEQLVSAYVGGTCGNVLTILSFLGWEAYPVARIGRDFAAKTMLSDLSRWGVRSEFLVHDDSVRTPIIVQKNKRVDGLITHRFVWQCPSCGKYLPTFRPPTKAVASGLLAQLRRQDVFFFDRVAPATIALAEASAERGALVVFEPARQSDERMFVRALKVAHIIKYSRDRIASLPLGKAKPWLHVQTMGNDGLRLRINGKAPWIAFPVLSPTSRLMDTSGAGDWTTAGILHSLTTEKAPIGATNRAAIDRAVRFGQALATLNCEHEGARGLMYAQTAEQVRANVSRMLRSKKRIHGADNTCAVRSHKYISPLCPQCPEDFQVARISSALTFA
jgi:fructokinase